MLARINRLTRDKDFENVFRRGLSFDKKIIFLKITKNSLGLSRFGFVVSQKISKKAVQRNKIKRRMREIVRLKLKEIKPGFDVVITAKPDIMGKSYQEIRETMEQILQKSHLLNTY